MYKKKKIRWHFFPFCQLLTFPIICLLRLFPGFLQVLTLWTSWLGTRSTSLDNLDMPFDVDETCSGYRVLFIFIHIFCFFKMDFKAKDAQAWKCCSLVKKPCVLSHRSPPQSQCRRRRPRTPCCFFCTVLYTEPEAAAFHLHPRHSWWDPQTAGATGCTINFGKRKRKRKEKSKNTPPKGSWSMWMEWQPTLISCYRQLHQVNPNCSEQVDDWRKTWRPISIKQPHGPGKVWVTSWSHRLWQTHGGGGLSLVAVTQVHIQVQLMTFLKHGRQKCCLIKYIIKELRFEKSKIFSRSTITRWKKEIGFAN